jgi:excisionase family DNA binding protein
MMMEEDKEYLTVEEFANIVRISAYSIRKAVRNKEIIALRPTGINGPYRIPRIELQRMASRQMYGDQ